MIPEAANRLIVFDLDGTLVDSRRDLADSANAVLESCGCRRLPETAIGRMVGDGAALLVARAFEAARAVPPPDALDRFLAIYNARLLAHTRAYPGVPEALRVLADRAALAVLTNKPLKAARAILEGLDLDTFFPLVVGGDGPYARKPDPAGLRHLMDETRVGRDATILVGDSMVDWRTARGAGTRVCLAQYGFGFEGVPAAGLLPGDALIDRASDLPTVV